MKILGCVAFNLEFIFFSEQPFYGIYSTFIPIQTLQFLTCLPTRQYGVENRDRAYFSLVLLTRSNKQTGKAVAPANWRQKNAR